MKVILVEDELAASDNLAYLLTKVNSIDYLLKPIDQEELSDALDRFEAQNHQNGIDEQQMQSLMHLIQHKPANFKQTFLVGLGDQLLPVKTADIAYFFIDTGLVKAVTVQERSYVLDIKLEDIEEALDPQVFYRANRQFIVRREAITAIKFHFNSKLLVEVHPVCSERIVVSKAKASDFKNWMGT